MEQEELWEQFVASGRIADYLKFTNGVRSENSKELSPETEGFVADKLWEDIFPEPDLRDEETSDDI